MLPGLTVPASLAGVLQVLRPSFTAPSFATFTLLVVGMVAQTGPRTVCGMLLGAGLQAGVSPHRPHRFFSVHRWSVDDTLFRRRGKQVHAAFWTHDASQPGRVTARGNRWVIVGIVVRLPFQVRPTCLPVLFRLWGGKGSATPVELARTLVGLLARAFPDRVIHVVGDAAYHGRPLRDLPERVTFTTRVQRNAVLYAPAPPPTGKRGRPRTRGDRIGNPTQAGVGASWRQTSVTRYGRTDTVAVAEVACLWYGAFGKRRGRLVLVGDRTAAPARELALFTTDLTSTVEQIVARYAGRWSVEVAIETAKGRWGSGRARNYLEQAVARTLRFGMLTMSLVVIWYALPGHHPEDVTDRRARQPWYTTKTEPSFEDMLAKLRRTIIAARFLPQRPGKATPEQINAVHLAWASAAA